MTSECNQSFRRLAGHLYNVVGTWDRDMSTAEKVLIWWQETVSRDTRAMEH
jgi:hypothetical protein